MPAWWPSLTALPGVRLRCRLGVTTSRALPSAGEIRGAIGRCLMASGHAEALACLFPSAREDEPQGPFGHATPWALHRTDDGFLEVGLFADAPSHLAAFLDALMTAGSGRIGQHAGIAFEAFEHQIDLIDGTWCAGVPARLGRWTVRSPAPKPCEWRLLSPLRLRRHGKDVAAADLQPRDVVAQLMRRVSGLLVQSGCPAPAWDARAQLGGIDGRPFLQCDLRPTTIDRFSSRQGQAMRLNGLIGRAVWPADVVAEFWPLLWMGQALHVGKTPCLGMGCYRLAHADGN